MEALDISRRAVPLCIASLAFALALLLLLSDGSKGDSCQDVKVHWGRAHEANKANSSGERVLVLYQHDNFFKSNPQGMEYGFFTIELVFDCAISNLTYWFEDHDSILYSSNYAEKERNIQREDSEYTLEISTKKVSELTDLENYDLSLNGTYFINDTRYEIHDSTTIIYQQTFSFSTNQRLLENKTIELTFNIQAHQNLSNVQISSRFDKSATLWSKNMGIFIDNLSKGNHSYVTYFTPSIKEGTSEYKQGPNNFNWQIQARAEGTLLYHSHLESIDLTIIEDSDQKEGLFESNQLVITLLIVGCGTILIIYLLKSKQKEED